MTLQLPAILGPYRLTKRLGHGGTCEVFRATYRGASGFRKEVAIKTLLPGHRDDPELQRQFIREAKLGARVTHANLVGVEDFGVDRGIHYLRMERVEGTDLRTLLQRCEPTVGVGVALVNELALALRYLHARTDAEGHPLGFVHRDVSPGNVMLTRYGEVKLIDFGIMKATRRRDLTQAGVRKGTTAYMSPEQARGEDLTKRSDQFPLGILLCELAAGFHPFAGGDRLETLERIRTGGPEGLQQLPERLRDTTRRLLATRPDCRFDDMANVVEALAPAQTGLEPANALERSEWRSKSG